jgi:hypothetical protein
LLPVSQAIELVVDPTGYDRAGITISARVRQEPSRGSGVPALASLALREPWPLQPTPLARPGDPLCQPSATQLRSTEVERNRR